MCSAVVRAEELHQLHYTVMLSDGDSKAFDAVVDGCPYGENVKLHKEDCVIMSLRGWVLHLET